MVLNRERHCRQCDGFSENPGDALDPKDVLNRVSIAQFGVLRAVAVSVNNFFLLLAEVGAHQNVFAGNVTGCKSSWGGHRAGILGYEREVVVGGESRRGIPMAISTLIQRTRTCRKSFK
jgi:hypothetical protein